MTQLRGALTVGGSVSLASLSVGGAVTAAALSVTDGLTAAGVVLVQGPMSVAAALTVRGSVHLDGDDPKISTMALCFFACGCI